ncbi:FAD-dependent oxidoreductase [Dactylosporangium aurantiacum]|uniref:D-amino-acid oxidase n=1 Tax=Dactylosporangium aurantiacum TaxID=35754 RepID=A0A9Q9IAN4_9ACTN|nr:FAD-dependent oxidoreductase [Dactylosporangium aurantiacum]MDG6106649.1 FAD-dependent oxidoreductase [Dactylosporangium aurantiacum]UWZ50808.1 FAD-dependent oxidoreductase [Dactylosporangium aurantiacum]
MAQGIDVLVLGAGVAGLTTAVCLAEAGCRVRVRTGEAPRDTTSAVAGAIIGGPLFADPVEAAAKWQPLDTNLAWHRTGLAEFGALAAVPGTGVRTARGRMVSRHGADDQPWMHSLPGYAPCTEQEHAGFPVAFRMSVPLVDMPRYLGYLTDRLLAAGGEVLVTPVGSLDEAAAEAPVVVNCTGVGARTLAGDPAVFPVRGQHVVVENPGLEEFFFERSPGATSTSFLPHGDRLLLGGTADRDAWSRTPDPAQTEQIVRRCAEVEPRIAGARILGVHAGLRATRPRTRLEEERRGDTRVIHNYGHGSVAVAMSWGCARDVQRLVEHAPARPAAVS